MSTRGTCGRGTRGRGKGRRGARVRSSSSETSEIPASPVAETVSYDRTAGDDALSQGMLRILKRVAGTNTGTRGRGDEIFRGVAGVAPNVIEYWIEATKRIIDDLYYTPEQTLKGVVSLLRYEAYQWWLIGKYVGANYVDTRRRECLNLTQRDISVAECEPEFLR
ncbi:ATP-dependent zinc metalloprotease FtsH [Gossypium australe]|uniref:ATP-dependent zinc metalloprotease FtsH n=1 Tax=Gossypium australe TaxID=47621 RepID=A0A5B6VVX2_9ROSI|nr:ATP-dependent zinc metalloprotease FtsH [Gossypium australe]